MIAAVSTIKDEADIVESSIRHLLGEGIDLVLIADASTDGTRDILDDLARETDQVKWLVDNERYHRQTRWIDRLAAEAHDHGADWIIPWDADEFWYAVSDRTIADELMDMGPEVRRLNARLWNHLDWNLRYAEHVQLPKVAYRWEPDAHIAPGNHDVSIPGGVDGVLEVRHLYYRGFTQFCSKVQARCRTLEPEGRERGDGPHHTNLEGASLDELEGAWEALQHVATVYDPIPVRACSRP